MHASRTLGNKLLVALAILAIVSGCTSAGTDREVARMARRLDSLAVTVTAMNAALQGRQAPAAPETLTVATTGAASLGRADAPVTIVEFTDYQCPFCGRHATTTFNDIKREYVDRGLVRYVLRDMPIAQIHPFAERAARAARCAGDQGPAKYWEYHHTLFETQRTLADSSFAGIATKVGLDRGRFDACLASDRFGAEVRQDAADAAAVQLTGTPGFVIGRTAPGGKISGVAIRGAYPFAQFKAAIDAALGPVAVAARE
jgi:protein-disulfide isomerase